MPTRSLDATFFVEAVPEIAYRDGLFHVCYEVGHDATFEVVLLPKTYFAAFAKAGEAARQCRIGKTADIISFPPASSDDDVEEATGAH
jgi:hypothetical protein